MVRNYVRKTKKGNGYTSNDLSRAKNAIQSQQMTVSAADKLFNIPRPTLYDHISGRRGAKSKTMGRNTALGISGVLNYFFQGLKPESIISVLIKFWIIGYQIYWF